MKDSRKTIIRLFSLCFLLLATTTLSGCSILGGAADALLWAPRKLWSVTGDKWFTVHNEQQTDLGPRRKPVGNPQSGGGPIPGFTQAPASQAFGQPMNMAPGQPQPGNFPPASGYPAAPMMPPAAYPAPAMSPQAGFNNGNGGAAQGYPAMPPMPPIPQPYQQAPTNQGAPGQMPMQGAGIQPPDISDMYDPDGASADAAYARGGAGNTSSKKGWKIPFISGNYKMERRYEPLAAEHIVNAEGEQQTENIQATEKPKSVRASSMFPLEKYAPKPSATIQKTDNKITGNTYPKLGHVPEKPENYTSSDAAAVELDNMLKEAEETQTKRDQIHNQNSEGQAQQPENPAKNQGNAGSQPTPPQNTKLKNNESENYQTKNRDIIATTATSSDAKIIEEVVKPKNYAKIPVATNKQEQKKGFFASLYDKIFRPAPKKVWRKSEPPEQQITKTIGNF